MIFLLHDISDLQDRVHELEGKLSDAEQCLGKEKRRRKELHNTLVVSLCKIQGRQKRKCGLFWPLCNAIAVVTILIVTYGGRIILYHLIVSVQTAQITADFHILYSNINYYII